MMKMFDPNEDYKWRLAASVSDQIKVLLSDKHLYQSVRVNMSEIQAVIAGAKGKKLDPLSRKQFDAAARLLHMPWEPEATSSMMRGITDGSHAAAHVMFGVPHIKIFCPKCDRTEAHNPHDDFAKKCIGAVTHSHGDIANGSCTMQILFLAYLCQSCKTMIVTFMICREGNKLTLVGRSPIECVQTPTFLPKNQRSFYSDAIVAFNSGQTLPAIFMLRTFIEQYAYNRHPDQKDYADKAVAAYMDSLPADLKSRFPSLRDAYERLSVAIHTASPDENFFRDVAEKISEHFDAKRLYKIT